jgi:multidrug transporter EmrE-like cation transporter
MHGMYWLFLFAGVALSVAGQALLKAGAGAGSFADQLTDVRTVAGLCVFGLSSMFYIVALRRIPLSVALPCTALSYFMVALIGHYGFGEPIGAQKIGALALIGLGVMLLATA